MPTRSNRHVWPAGFTLVELLVAISMIALLIGTLLPALGSARTAARQLANNTRLRGIHQAMVAASRDNNGFLPGVDSVENYLAGVYQENTALSGLNMAASKVLIKGDFVSADFFISPAEVERDMKSFYTDAANPDVNDPGDAALPVNDVFFRNHSSYGMAGGRGASAFFLNETRNQLSAGTPNPLPANGPLTTIERLGPIFAEAWKDNHEGKMPVVTDRVVFRNAAGSGYGQSIWAEAEGEWEGGIAWNDNHVSYEADHAEVAWELEGYTGQGLIPAGFDDPVTLPFTASVFIYQ